MGMNINKPYREDYYKFCVQCGRYRPKQFFSGVTLIPLCDLCNDNEMKANVREMERIGKLVDDAFDRNHQQGMNEQGE